MQLRRPVALCFTLLSACANGLGTAGPDEAVSTAPAPAHADFREIAAADWELASGEEKYAAPRVGTSAWARRLGGLCLLRFGVLSEGYG